MISVTHSIDKLAADLGAIPVRATRELPGVVHESAKDGNRIAKAFAKESAGAHGKHYHKAFTVEKTGPLAYEYGPDESKPQGGMSFEGGSRNQPPHNDLAKSADVVSVEFPAKVSETVGGWFW